MAALFLRLRTRRSAFAVAGSDEIAEAATVSVQARQTSSIAGVEGGLVSSLGQIRANQVTQTLIIQANKNFGMLSSSAATKREIAGMNVEAQGTQSGRILDAAKETGLRSQGTNQQFGMMKYDASTAPMAVKYLIASELCVRPGSQD